MTLYERRAPRWVHVASLIPTVALTVFMVYFAFGRDLGMEGIEGVAELDTTFKVMIGLFAAVGVFMTGVIVHRLVRNPAYFVMTEEGFYYSPGGVSTGLIRWRDIVELREEGVFEGGSGRNSVSPALAVVLRNAEEYVARFPRVLKPLFGLRGQLNGSALLLRRADLGGDYPAIKQIMDEQIRQYAGVR